MFKIDEDMGHGWYKIRYIANKRDADTIQTVSEETLNVLKEQGLVYGVQGTKTNDGS